LLFFALALVIVLVANALSARLCCTVVLAAVVALALLTFSETTLALALGAFFLAGLLLLLGFATFELSILH
jgi:hypothetical protein